MYKYLLYILSTDLAPYDTDIMIAYQLCSLKYRVKTLSLFHEKIMALHEISVNIHLYI